MRWYACRFPPLITHRKTSGSACWGCKNLFIRGGAHSIPQVIILHRPRDFSNSSNKIALFYNVPWRNSLLLKLAGSLTWFPYVPGSDKKFGLVIDSLGENCSFFYICDEGYFYFVYIQDLDILFRIPKNL